MDGTLPLFQPWGGADSVHALLLATPFFSPSGITSKAYRKKKQSLTKYQILLIIEGCPDRFILSITIKPNILQKTLFHRFSPKFIKV